MNATIDHTDATLMGRLAGYARAARYVTRRSRPAWLIAGVDIIAVLAALGLVQAIGSMIVRTAPPGEVAAADDAVLAPLSNVPGANFARIPPAALMAELADRARAVLPAVPSEQILFAAPASLDGRFTTALASIPMGFGNPAETSASGLGDSQSAAGEPASGGTFVPPPVVRPSPDTGGDPSPVAPSGPAPALLVYAPLPAATAPLEEDIVAPTVERLAQVADDVTGPALNLTEQLGITVNAGVDNSAGSDNTTRGPGGSPAARIEVSTADSSGKQDTRDSTNGGQNSVTRAVTQVTSATTDTLRATVSDTVGSVGRLLR